MCEHLVSSMDRQSTALVILSFLGVAVVGLRIHYATHINQYHVFFVLTLVIGFFICKSRRDRITLVITSIIGILMLVTLGDYILPW